MKPAWMILLLAFVAPLHAENESLRKVSAEMAVAAQAFLDSLDEAQSAKARIAFDDAEREGLIKLITEYADRHRPELEKDQLAEITRDFDKLRFGWAGGIEPGQAYYYRIQGADFLVEVSNIQNDANHIHTVWRDRAGDFGRDVLGEHHHEHKH